MNANELRIGNLVELAIKMEGSLIERCRVKDNILEVNKEFIFGELNTFCNPIPLTEEWLLKCGGIDKGYTIEIKCKGKKIVFSWYSKVVETGIRSGWNSKKYKHIKYIHQLQNLYWCLCGEELKINIA